MDTGDKLIEETSVKSLFVHMGRIKTNQKRGQVP
jgi:hypothetical protein